MNPVVKHLLEDKIVDMARKAGMKDSGVFGDGWVSDDPEDKYPECVYTENLMEFAGLVSELIVLKYPFQMNNRIRVLLDAAYNSGYKAGSEKARKDNEQIS